MSVVTIKEKVERCRSLCPHNLNPWEQGVRESLERLALSSQIHQISDIQLASLNALYTRHFG